MKTTGNLLRDIRVYDKLVNAIIKGKKSFIFNKTKYLTSDQSLLGDLHHDMCKQHIEVDVIRLI